MTVTVTALLAAHLPAGAVPPGWTKPISGKAGRPQLDLHGIAPVVTFGRSKGSPGVYYTRE